MLPCILEGLPSQDSEVTMACPPALDELLGRSSKNNKLQHMTNGDSSAHVSAKVAAVWPQSLSTPPFQPSLSAGSLTGSAAVLKGSPESSKGSPTSVIGTFSSVKGAAHHGKPPVSPKRKLASAHSDAVNIVTAQTFRVSSDLSISLRVNTLQVLLLSLVLSQSHFPSLARIFLYGLPPSLSMCVCCC